MTSVVVGSLSLHVTLIRLITLATARRFFASGRDIVVREEEHKVLRGQRRGRRTENAVALDDGCQHTGPSLAAALAIIRSYSHLAKCTFTSRRICGCARFRELFFFFRSAPGYRTLRSSFLILPQLANIIIHFSIL